MIHHFDCGLPRAQHYYYSFTHFHPFPTYAHCLRLVQGIVRDRRHIRKTHFFFFSSVLITDVVQNHLNRPTRPSGGRRRRRRFWCVKKKKLQPPQRYAYHIWGRLQFTLSHRSSVPGVYRLRFACARTPRTVCMHDLVAILTQLKSPSSGNL